MGYLIGIGLDELVIWYCTELLTLLTQRQESMLQSHLVPYKRYRSIEDGNKAKDRQSIHETMQCSRHSKKAQERIPRKTKPSTTTLLPRPDSAQPDIKKSATHITATHPFIHLRDKEPLYRNFLNQRGYNKERLAQMQKTAI